MRRNSRQPIRQVASMQEFLMIDSRPQPTRVRNSYLSRNERLYALDVFDFLQGMRMANRGYSIADEPTV